MRCGNERKDHLRRKDGRLLPVLLLLESLHDHLAAQFRQMIEEQFAVAMILISLTLATIVQVRRMQEHSLGFNPEQIVVIKSPKAFM